MINREEIVKKLAAYCEQKGGQNKAAQSIKGVSAATVSQMLNQNWEKISDEMWRKVQNAIGAKVKGWNVAEAGVFSSFRSFSIPSLSLFLWTMTISSRRFKAQGRSF